MNPWGTRFSTRSNALRQVRTRQAGIGGVSTFVKETGAVSPAVGYPGAELKRGCPEKAARANRIAAVAGHLPWLAELREHAAGALGVSECNLHAVGAGSWRFIDQPHAGRRPTRAR